VPAAAGADELVAEAVLLEDDALPHPAAAIAIATAAPSAAGRRL